MNTEPTPPPPPPAGHAPPLTCSHWLGGPVDAPILCPNDARWHIIWTTDVENGIYCDQHYDVERRRWTSLTSHAYRMECSMPGAVLLIDEQGESRCEVDESSLGLPELSEVRTVDA